MEVTNWSDIPYEVKLLIKRQYKDYFLYVSNPLTWENWAKKQGYDISK